MSINHKPGNAARDVKLAFALHIKRHLGALIIPVTDGQIHRFDDPDGKPGNQACWYFLSMLPTPHGCCGNWRLNSKFGYRSDASRSVSFASKQHLQSEIRRTQNKQLDLRKIEQSRAAMYAQKIWDEASPANDEHPYLANKSIPSSYLRQCGDELLVKLTDHSGDIINIQRIDMQGRKRFLRGGRVKGCYALAGTIRPEGKLYLCEGWATGLTLHLETGAPVACAMNCHNLRDVGLAIRAQFPIVEIVIAGDDDRWTQGNPGRTAAIAAALTLRTRVIFPKWPDGANEKLTDFNDLYRWSKQYGPK